VLHGVKPRALGEHPAGENPLHLALEIDLVDLNEGGGVGRLGGRRRVAHPWRHFQRTELDCLINGDLEVRDAPRDLVEGGKHSDRVLDRVGIGGLEGEP
jgi:hypothetical protein